MCYKNLLETNFWIQGDWEPPQKHVSSSNKVFQRKSLNFITSDFTIESNFRVENESHLDYSDNMLSNRIGRTTPNVNLPIERFRRRSKKKLKKRQLVFIEDSPDYCKRNFSEGKLFLHFVIKISVHFDQINIFLYRPTWHDWSVLFHRPWES